MGLTSDCPFITSSVAHTFITYRQMHTNTHTTATNTPDSSAGKAEFPCFIQTKIMLMIN